MPELPEVETIARELAPRVVGRTITGFKTDWPRAIRHPDLTRFARDVLDREILEVARRAKWLVLTLSGDLALIIQVKMTGQLFVVPPDVTGDRHVHHVFSLSDGMELRIRDTRKFGRLGLYRRDDAGRVLGADEALELFAGHGPEPLDEAFTLRDFRARLRARRGRLKPLLLDQAFLAGIGNIYADEALWRSRLHPLRSAPSLRPADERRLYTAIRDVLNEGIARRGSSIDDYTSLEGDGEMQDFLNIYQRTGRPCPRCGRPTRRIVLGARGTHFCSWCQRLPGNQRTDAVRALLRSATAASRRGPRWSELPVGAGAVGARQRGEASNARPRGGRSK
ncbi:MAG: bifunctional DNA-formamidopyrimidine glycosylase/DNA-(apurinic or apyrimidinic site) lyase, partial [Chloroflexi bacterium]|nr:bifunctional DNA-formamidopyrimidine glycosylase/DNA-(apurinic or apyrimidinic site) lyase [Chloroflexota bacterium]